MGDGGLGFMMMAAAAWAVGILGVLPLAIVGLHSELRRSPVAWTIAFGIASWTLLKMAVQVRTVVDSGGWSDLLFWSAYLLAVAPSFLLVTPSVRTKWWNWPVAFASLVLIVPLGQSEMGFRDRSERLITAVEAGNWTSAHRLLTSGADPDCFDVGHCAINVAIDHRNWRIAELLVEHGATNTEYHKIEGGPATSAAKKLEKLGQHDLAHRILLNHGRD